MAGSISQTLDSYIRGILVRPHPRERGEGYLLEALNVVCPGGRIRGRPGLKPSHSADAAGVIFGGGFHVRADGSRDELIGAADKIQRVPAGGDPVDLPLTLLPSTLQTRDVSGGLGLVGVQFLSMSGGLNLTFIYDGRNTNLAWDGTALTRMGIDFGPTAPVPTTPGGASTVTRGQHFFVITLDNGRHEGDRSQTPREVITASNTLYRFASPTNVAGANPANNEFDDPSITTWHLWATIAGGQDYFEVGSADIGINIDFSVSDDTLSAGTVLEEIVNRLPEGPFTSLCEHKGQLVGVTASDPNVLRFSNINENYPVPEGWPPDWIVPVSHGDGDQIVALASFYDWLVIFKRQGSWSLAGDWPAVTLQPLLSAGGGTHEGIGIANPQALLHLENEVAFASRDGFYDIQRFQSPIQGLEAKRLSGPIDSLYSAVNFAGGAGVFFDRRKRVLGMLGRG